MARPACSRNPAAPEAIQRAKASVTSPAMAAGMPVTASMAPPMAPGTEHTAPTSGTSHALGAAAAARTGRPAGSPAPAGETQNPTRTATTQPQAMAAAIALRRGDIPVALPTVDGRQHLGRIGGCIEADGGHGTGGSTPRPQAPVVALRTRGTNQLVRCNSTPWSSPRNPGVSRQGLGGRPGPVQALNSGSPSKSPEIFAPFSLPFRLLLGTFLTSLTA